MLRFLFLNLGQIQFRTMSEPKELILGGVPGKGFYPIEDKLVIAVTSSALFDMTESNRIFEEEGCERYQEYQSTHLEDILKPGVAFPFIRKLLALNAHVNGKERNEDVPEEDRLIEVVLFSRNSPTTGLRAFRSIQHYMLNISRACFSSGSTNFQYLDAFNSLLYLSTNENDVKAAMEKGYAAGLVRAQSLYLDNDNEDVELRIAFDFDGVIADRSAELVTQEQGIESFADHEALNAQIPLGEGPLKRFLEQISKLQKLERDKFERRKNNNEPYRRFIRTAIITARNAPAHERVITTLTSFGIEVDEVFFLGGIDKARILKVFRPHLFFDDKLDNLRHLEGIPSVLIMMQ